MKYLTIIAAAMIAMLTGATAQTPRVVMEEMMVVCTEN